MNRSLKFFTGRISLPKREIRVCSLEHSTAVSDEGSVNIGRMGRPFVLSAVSRDQKRKIYYINVGLNIWFDSSKHAVCPSAGNT